MENGNNENSRCPKRNVTSSTTVKRIRTTSSFADARNDPVEAMQREFNLI
jgi:hypothetical protein